MLLEELRVSRWFARQPGTLRDRLAAAGRLRALGAGQWVYGEGDDATGLVMVLSGMLRLEAMVDDRTILVGVAQAGGAFGQSQRHGGGPRIVTARAGPPSRVFTVSDAALARVGAEEPLLWQSVSTLVYAQLDASVHSLAQMLALPPRARIARRLLPFAAVGEAPLSQSDLAELCGLSRKAVNAHLAALERAGAIGRGYGHVRVIDAALLERAGSDVAT